MQFGAFDPILSQFPDKVENLLQQIALARLHFVDGNLRKS